MTMWRGSGRLVTLWAMGLALGSGACSLDFNEAVPCATNEQCAEGFVCNVAVGRCETSLTPVADTTPDPDVTDDVVDDPDDTGGDADVETDAPDVAPDSVADATGDPDEGGDVCVPTAEVCNGMDDDCNDLPDDGIDCGTCPDATNMALILRGGEAPFCVDLYEASRPDATLASPGSDETMATSRSAVIPWFGVGFDAAATACSNASKRICTAAEWTEACGGPQAFLYPYNATTYDPITCNGADTPDPDAVGPTSSRLNCTSPEGSRDMSGNLEEWIAGPVTRGGSYEDGNLQLRCSGEGETPDPATPGNAVGFRCCADPL